jgi:hypothetical protein
LLQLKLWKVMELDKLAESNPTELEASEQETVAISTSTETKEHQNLTTCKSSKSWEQENLATSTQTTNAPPSGRREQENLANTEHTPSCLASNLYIKGEKVGQVRRQDLHNIKQSTVYSHPRLFSIYFYIPVLLTERQLGYVPSTGNYRFQRPTENIIIY